MTGPVSLERKSTVRNSDEPMSRAEFEAAIRAVGAERYHDKHPFHHMLHGGKLKKPQVQAWALNRYCYQAAVPRKDAALISRLYDRELRREWLHRVLDHDWAPRRRAASSVCWPPDRRARPRPRLRHLDEGSPAGDALCGESYVTFVREQPITVAVASSLTELFAPKIHKERIAGMLENYDFIDDKVMAYYKRRLTQAPRDADFA